MRLTKRGCLVALLVALLVFTGLTLGAGFVLLRALGLSSSGDRGEAIRLTVPDGATATEIGDLLERRGVIRSALGFRIATMLEGGAEDIQAGRYRLATGLTAPEALAALARGPELEFVTVTFPEGSWLTDFARIVGRKTPISRRAFLSLARRGEIRSPLQPSSVDTLEGLLWPSTYRVDERETAASLLRRLVDEMAARVKALEAGQAAPSRLTPYQRVIVASMVEAEARVPSDRRKIAAVIFNRLDQGMPLGIDATVAYAVGKRGGELTQEDLEVDSSYNTRVVPGLPPTPIGAPGLASLRATVRPAVGDWLYFVLADCGGRHAFSESYEDFLDDKAAYQTLDC